MAREPSQAGDAKAAWWSRGIRAGDRAALADFYGAWFDRVLGAARAMTGRDEAFGLDIVQESMLRIVRSIHAMESNASLEAWVMRVVRSACVDAIRRESRRGARERRVPDRESAAAAGVVAERREHAAALVRRLRRLGDADLELVWASAGMGPTLSEIARSRGESVDAVHARARRLVARLRKEGERDGSKG